MKGHANAVSEWSRLSELLDKEIDESFSMPQNTDKERMDNLEQTINVNQLYGLQDLLVEQTGDEPSGNTNDFNKKFDKLKQQTGQIFDAFDQLAP